MLNRSWYVTQVTEKNDWLIVAHSSERSHPLTFSVPRGTPLAVVRAMATDMAGETGNFVISRVVEEVDLATGAAGSVVGPWAQTETAEGEDAVRARWLADVTVLKDELVELCALDDTFAQTWSVVLTKLDGQIGDAEWTLPDWLFVCYSHTITVGVRRLLDTDSRSHSLVRLLNEMIDKPSLLSREHLTARFLENDGDGTPWAVELVRQQASAVFDRLCGVDQAHVPPALLKDLRTSLRAAGGEIEAYVNHFVAHRSREVLQRVPDLLAVRRTLQHAFDALFLVNYCLTGAEWVSPVPVNRGPWTRVFRRAWLPEGEELPAYDPLYDEAGKPLDIRKVRDRLKSKLEAIEARAPHN